jgi:hypothetical protein
MYNPNDYRRCDVVALARIIDPTAWKNIAVDTNTPEEYRLCGNSVSLAGRILAAGYRDCKFL